MSMASTVRIGRRGQIQLPARVRVALGLRDGDELLLDVRDDAVVLRPRARRFAAYLDRLHRARTPASGS